MYRLIAAHQCSRSRHCSAGARRYLHPQAGTTLIEVLVAVLIFSFGFLGFVGLQARALQFTIAAEDSERAALLANEMAATMVTRQTTDPALLIAAIAAWQARARDPAVAGLPNGAASAVRNGNVTTIRITWRATSALGTMAASASQYVTQVVVP